MNIADFESLLKREIGLDAGSIGSSAVERAVRERMAALSCPDAQAYAERVRASGSELQELIETIVVPETWFFRDREAFTALARLVREEWARTHPEGMLRVLSAPCSTGEEPYSIAMALLDAGLAPERFRIDAIDVSHHALACARRALYGKNSFRGSNLQFRDQYFASVGARWQLNEPVRRQVDFHVGNLLDPTLLADREPYGVIFCRNLLIYFDRPTQDRAMVALNRLLAHDGLLFVGPSETGLSLSHGFEPLKVPLAFAFRKPGLLPPKPKVVELAPVRRLSAPPSRKLVPSRPIRDERVSESPRPESPVTLPSDPLEEIARLANQGHLAEAAKLSEAHLRAHGRSAKALYLLGVVRDAAGQHAEAAELYRKALYLEPHHHDALMHLAYFLERKGDAAGAKVLTARARRVAEKEKVKS